MNAVLERFCTKLAVLGVHPFVGAMDASKGEKQSWITLENGVHVPVQKGQTKKEAAKQFVAKKETSAVAPSSHLKTPAFQSKIRTFRDVYKTTLKGDDLKKASQNAAQHYFAKRKLEGMGWSSGGVTQIDGTQVSAKLWSRNAVNGVIEIEASNGGQTKKLGEMQVDLGATPEEMAKRIDQTARGLVAKERNGKASQASKPADKPEAKQGTASRPKLEQRHLDAVDHYASGEGMYINQFLRKGERLNNEDAQFVKDLDHVLSTPVKDKTLYRSVDAKALFGGLSAIDFENIVGGLVYNDKSKEAQKALAKANASIGRTKLEKGYMSTTRDPEVAEGWGGFTGSDMPVVMKLNTSAGTKGADISDMTPKARKAEAADPQKETLLARNQSYEIKSIYPRNGQIYVECDMIDNKTADSATAGDKACRNISFDAAPSMRSKDANGFLHVASSNISKEVVNPYYGREIPGWEEKGLDPNHIFYGYRAGEELAKAAKTFDGLPLLIDHHIEDAEAPQKEYRVGSLGTDARWEAPYLKNSLIVTDAEAIRAIEDGRMKELSCAYRYEPDWTPGTFEGVPYDFIMRNIQGNHVALVEEGRAGADVVVADAKPRETITSKMEKTMKGFFRRFRGAKDSDPEVEMKEVQDAKGIVKLAQGLIDLHKRNPETGEIMDVTEDADKAEAVMAAVSKIASKLAPEEVEELTKAIQALGMDEEVEEVVETEDDDLDTAEAVKYGEEKERDKLMSEHMREDKAEDEDEPALDEEAVKEAADKCGMDAEDPAFQKAFAEGVRYGEKKEKAEPEHLDRLHESEGMKKAMDEEEVKTAMDAALRAASTRAEAKVVAKFRALSAAASAVRPVLGDIDPLAFDSADSIYGAALKAQGVDIRRHPRAAWRSIFEVSRQQAAKASFAQDSSMRRDYSGAFAGLNRIKRG